MVIVTSTTGISLVTVQTNEHLVRAAGGTHQPELTIFLEFYLISCKQNMLRENRFFWSKKKKRAKCKQIIGFKSNKYLNIWHWNVWNLIYWLIFLHFQLPLKKNITTNCCTLTLISIFPTLAVERMMGLPTSAGKICSGKLEPAYPHLTNYEKEENQKKKKISRIQNAVVSPPLNRLLKWLGNANATVSVFKHTEHNFCISQ